MAGQDAQRKRQSGSSEWGGGGVSGGPVRVAPAKQQAEHKAMPQEPGSAEGVMSRAAAIGGWGQGGVTGGPVRVGSRGAV
jgi:hypothetical protein